VHAAELVQSAPAGGQVEVRSSPLAPANIRKAVEARDFDLFQFGAFSGASPAGDQLDLFGCQRPLNLSGWCDRLVTRDLDNADASSTTRGPAGAAS
jgi:hypothetical protein